VSKGIITGVALFAAFLLQTAILPVFGVSSVGPDLIFAVLIPASMLWQPIPTAFMGAAVGLIIDILFGHGIGVYAIPYLVVPWLAGVYCKKFFRENAFIPAGIAAAAVVARDVLTAIAIYLGRMELAITWGLVLRELANALLTAGLTIPLHLMFYSYQLKTERHKPGLIYFGR